MIRAAILPYARVPGGACCVVVVHDGPAVLVREDVPVGHLATVDGRITRIVGPPEVAAVVARVVEIVRGRDVTQIEVACPSKPGVEGDRGRDIAYGIQLDTALFSRVRLAYGGQNEGPGVGGETSSPAPAREPAGFTGPDHLAPTPAQSITSVSTGSVRESEADPTPAPPPAQAPKAGRRVLAVDPGSKHVAAVVLEKNEGPTPKDEPLSAATQERVTPSRGLLLHHSPALRTQPDGMSGAMWLSPEHGTTRALAQAPVARYVASLSLTIGRDVPLKRPKLVTPKNGREPYYKMTRHEVTDGDLDELLRTLARFALEHDVDEVAVEVATFAHKGAGAFLLRSNEIGGEVCGWLRAAGLPVRRVSSRVWRARVREMYDGGERSGDGRGKPDEGREARSGVCGAVGSGDRGRSGRNSVGIRGSQEPCGTATPGEGSASARDPGLTWRPAVRALVADLPPDADAHILDASGAALWALAPELALEVAPPAKPRAPRAQGGGKAGAWTPEKAERQRRKRDASKRARGCIGCVGQHHQAACPIEVARLAKVAPSMRGNQNAKKGL